MGGKTLETYGLPQVTRHRTTLSQEYLRYTNYPTNQQIKYLAEHEHLLTPEQSHSAIRSAGRIAIATASSGIGATLLQGGRTVHSTFKIPLDVQFRDNPTCAIKKGTALATIIKNCGAIIVDEAPMMHRVAYEALDRTLRDITGHSNTFGGIPVLLSGDFRQILPVVKNGTRANIIDAAFKSSPLWSEVTTFHLQKNLRAHLTNDANAAAYLEFLLSVGEGTYTIQQEPNTIHLPGSFNTLATPDALIQRVYADMETHANGCWNVRS